MLIQELYDEKLGFNPLLITENWQVAQLNYCSEQSPDNIYEMEMHLHTDEIFILLSGSAFLLAADKDMKDMETGWLQPGKVYNIAKEVWHNIALLPGSRVLIVEDAYTHEEEKPITAIPEHMRTKIQKFE